MRIIVIICLFQIHTTSCYSEKETNDTKFVLLEAQASALNFPLNIDFLAKKVHKSKLIIDVGFADNKTCGFDEAYRRKLYTAITRSLTVWLAPLKDRADVTNDIVGLMEIRKRKVDEQDDLGNTALHYAAYSQTLHGDTLYKFLVDRGAKEDIPNIKRKTASAIASEQNQ